MQFKEENMSKYKEYKCTRCGYVYREGRGESRQDIPPGTKFEDLRRQLQVPHMQRTQDGIRTAARLNKGLH